MRSAAQTCQHQKETGNPEPTTANAEPVSPDHCRDHYKHLEPQSPRSDSEDGYSDTQGSDASNSPATGRRRRPKLSVDVSVGVEVSLVLNGPLQDGMICLQMERTRAKLFPYSRSFSIGTARTSRAPAGVDCSKPSIVRLEASDSHVEMSFRAIMPITGFRDGRAHVRWFDVAAYFAQRLEEVYSSLLPTEWPAVAAFLKTR